MTRPKNILDYAPPLCAKIARFDSPSRISENKRTGEMTLRQFQLLMVLVLATLTTVASASDLAPTHKQLTTFQPKHGTSKNQLHTYCLTAEGNILASVSTGGKNFLQCYSPELKMVSELELPFPATAANVAPNGTIYVGGAGKVAIVSATLELKEVQRSPQLADEETLKERMVKAAQEKAEKTKEALSKQIEQIAGRIEKLKESGEEINDRDKKRLETYLKQKEMLEDNLKRYTESSVIDPAKLMATASGVRAIAATKDAVFVCCNALEGYGYEVWKTKPDLSEASVILTGLSGCCGQFDIQATEELLVLAENTKFSVGVLNHEGKRLSSFGQSNRMGGEGFGSCCNPMNVRCCENGDILTAESSIGTIKRFDKDGKLVGVVGKAKIGGGCKHVSLGYDKTRDRYYMQYEDKNAICVLVPNSEAPEFTEEELLAKKARQGLGEKLVGTWSVGGKAKKNSGGLFSAIGSAIGGGQVVDPFLSDSLEFKTDGNMVGASSDLKWSCVRQDEKTLFVNMEMQEVGYDLKVVFDEDDKITVSVMLDGENVYSTKKYARVVEDSKKTEEKAEDKTGGQ